MFDLKITGGLVVDGTGTPGKVMDIGIVGDRIVAMGDLAEGGAEEIDATGRVVAPGFVDIHTHYDGQATWDQEMAPSSWHGVTTLVMGNCGVGFAPAAPDRQEWLVGLMEGVEEQQRGEESNARKEEGEDERGEETSYCNITMIGK